MNSIKLAFQNTSVDLYNHYKQAQRAVEASYHQGKEDAYEEILKYLLSQAKGSLKYVPINEFISYLESRYQFHRFHCSKQPPANIDTSHVNQLITQLAEQGQRIGKMEGQQIMQKIPNLEIFKVKDSKKRKYVQESVQQFSDQDDHLKLIVQQRSQGLIKTRRLTETSDSRVSNFVEGLPPVVQMSNQFKFNLSLNQSDQ